MVPAESSTMRDGKSGPGLSSSQRQPKQKRGSKYEIPTTIISSSECAGEELQNSLEKSYRTAPICDVTSSDESSNDDVLMTEGLDEDDI